MPTVLTHHAPMTQNTSTGKYLTELKDAGLTCSGILVKILHVRNFLDFLLNSVEVNSTEEAKIAKMVTKLKSWHSHLLKQNYKVGILHTLCYHTYISLNEA